MPSNQSSLNFTVMAKKLSEGQFQITDGPSKFDLMASLFDGKVVKITCDLSGQATKIKICPKLEVVFIMVGMEDGSRESWIGEVNFCDSNYEHERRRFYYDTRRRTGHIREITRR